MALKKLAAPYIVVKSNNLVMTCAFQENFGWGVMRAESGKWSLSGQRPITSYLEYRQDA